VSSWNSSLATWPAGYWLGLCLLLSAYAGLPTIFGRQQHFVCWPWLGRYSLSALSGSCVAIGRFPCAHLVPAATLTLSAKVRFTAYPASKCAGR
jgi:hypothetical protein